ncbi:MAG: arsenate reductase ArsC [Planctomycetes bacterium]|nr:arsenate reductase ArsC [Planctomycetota bacterium]
MSPSRPTSTLKRDPRRVLFLCTGNSARSQMAEALLRHRAGGIFEVHSAGLRPRPIHPFTYQVMSEIGIDIRGQHSKRLDEVRHLKNILFLIVVCAQAERNCPESFAPAAVRLFWPIDDPSAVKDDGAAKLRKFRQVRDEILERIDRWLAEEVPPEWFHRDQDS